MIYVKLPVCLIDAREHFVQKYGKSKGLAIFTKCMARALGTAKRPSA